MREDRRYERRKRFEDEIGKGVVSSNFRAGETDTGSWRYFTKIVTEGGKRKLKVMRFNPNENPSRISFYGQDSNKPTNDYPNEIYINTEPYVISSKNDLIQVLSDISRKANVPLKLTRDDVERAMIQAGLKTQTESEKENERQNMLQRRRDRMALNSRLYRQRKLQKIGSNIEPVDSESTEKKKLEEKERTKILNDLESKVLEDLGLSNSIDSLYKEQRISEKEKYSRKGISDGFP